MLDACNQFSMKWFLPLFLFCLTAGALQAQDYRFSGGVRSGYSSGLTLKYFSEPEVGLDAIMSFRNYGVQLTGLVEHHRLVDEKFRGIWYWFYGFGVHTGYYTRPYNRNLPNNLEDDRFFRPSLGGDAIIGLQYNLEAIPITLGAEFKPYLDIFGVRFMHFQFWDAGISIRYNFD